MKTIFSRTLFALAVFLLTALLLVGLSFQLLVRDYLEEQAMDRLQADCSTLTNIASAYYSQESLADRSFLLNLALVSSLSDADAVICDARGRLLACSDEPFGCEHQGLVVGERYLQTVLSQDFVKSRGMVEGLYDAPRYVVSAPIRAADGTALGIVIASTSTDGTKSVLNWLSDTFLLVSLFVVAAFTVAVIIYARKHSSPLREMASAATAFGHGNLKARVGRHKNDPREMQELALAFNNMAASLEKSEYQRREFVANVSHELKTPMTTIGGYVDGILDGTIPQEKHAHYLQIVSNETKRLNRLVRSMLDISRLQEQGGIPEEQKTRFDLSECAGQVLITLEQAIVSKKLQVQVDLPEYPLFTNASRDHITQVIYNLLDNAVKFCPTGGNLGLTVRKGGSKAYVTVSNDGATIPAEELPLLFDRFHKQDKSRSENRDGWGLGLAIVKTIICSHGEDISVTSKDGVTAFTFTLPVVN